jgi:hypothetical protein
MKFYTSYYANMKNIPANYLCVGISRVCPEWLIDNEPPNFLFVRGNILAPSSELLSDMKSGKITEDEYTERYKEQIHKTFSNNHFFTDFDGWIESMEEQFEDKYEAIVFLCYEKPSDFCHRHILREMFNYEYHVRCDELKTKEPTVKKQEEIKTTALF